MDSRYERVLEAKLGHIWDNFGNSGLYWSAWI